MRRSRPTSGATRISWSSRGLGSSARATRSGLNSAMSDRYALIGNPVAHSKSPQIHAQFARATGQDIEYSLIEAPLDGFVQAVERWRAGGGKGLNVTLPFKREALRLCEHLSDRARAAQAVNTLRFDDAFGDNTDGIGLIRDFSENLQYTLGKQRV